MKRLLNNYQPKLILAIVEQKEQIKEIDMKEKEIHNKAIRLLEGGIVNADGFNVTLRKYTIYEDACMICEMYSICRIGTEMYSVCMECEKMSQDECYLKLTHPG